MKVQSDYFRRKQSKKGIALSTAMAICIVLALLVAVLVSMATLNITTTQATISQREAYIQAKSALAFVESYYSQNDVPGKGKEGESCALFVFNDDVISNGAKVYVTKIGGAAQIDTSKIEDLKKNCVDTYVDVVNQGKYLDLTAHCKYGSNDAYELSKEFNTGGSNESKLPYWEGNLTYTAKGESRVLRIHVRTNPAIFNNKAVTGSDDASPPYLFTWYTSVNKVQTSNQAGNVSIVNKMSGDETKYPTVQNGKWGSSGPEANCTMTYEGNGWYVTEVNVETENHVNYVNAIITKANSHRDNEGDFTNQQSWEFFGIPLPSDDETGDGNGYDVYISLNRNELRDARYWGTYGQKYNKSTYWTKDGSGTEYDDEFTHIFEADCSADIDAFAKECSSWYTVYTKKDTSTMHYRKQGVYDNSAGPGGDFVYEGYGWWRCTYTSDKWGSTVAGYSFGSANIVSQNRYGKEVTREGFVCEFSDGSTALFATEAEANAEFAAQGEGKKAGEYLTVNVKSSQQPVDAQVATKIKYESNWDKGSSTPTPSPTAKSKNEELEFQELKSTSYEKEFALIGAGIESDGKSYPINNWGIANGESKGKYNNLKNHILTKIGDNLYQIKLKNCKKIDYQFKVIEMLEDSGEIPDSGWSVAYGNGTGENGNTKISKDWDQLKDGCTMVITFNYENKHSTVTCEDAEISEFGDYAVYGWCNSWGTKTSDGTTYTPAAFEAVDKMTPESGDWLVYVADDEEDYVDPNQTISLKIVKMSSDAGAIPSDAEFYPSSSAEDNKTFTAPSGTGRYIATIKFNPKTGEIDASFDKAPENVVKKKQYDFYNGKNQDADNKATDFTAWSEIYLTVIKGGVPETSEKVDFTSGQVVIPIMVPEDADEFYLSNMDSTQHSNADFQCTAKISNTTPENVQLIPTHLEDDTNAVSDTKKSWDIYYPGSNVEKITGEGTMVYSGSVQTNYYDVPLVKILRTLIPGASGHYAFAAYPYQNKNVGGGVGSVSFNEHRYVTYQGEKYYYTSTSGYSGLYSFLIVRDSNDSKGGILLENHMALMTDTNGVSTKMNNRGGGVFTSDPQSFTVSNGDDGSGNEILSTSNLKDYGGYTPNWYTFKVPVTEDVKIVSITGVTGINDVIVSSNQYITPAKVTDFYRQPIYISQEYEKKDKTKNDETEYVQKVKYYTYNTNTGSVDTSKEDKVAVYFANDNGDFSDVAVYAYDLRGEHEIVSISRDTSDGDRSASDAYYKYEFPTGQYCYFVFFDPTSSTVPIPADGKLSDELYEKAAKKSAILYLTGYENLDTHECDLLAYNSSSKAFAPYVHPKTTALYNAIALEAAVQASRIPERYTYDVATNSYTDVNTLEMGQIKTEASNARSYANNGDGGVWRTSGSANYTKLATAVQNFITAIQKARIYVSDDVPDYDPTSTQHAFPGDHNRVFKEGSYRDDTFQYQTRWVNALSSVYENAMSVYGNASAQKNPDTLDNYVSQIESLIAYPLLDPSSKAVSIAVCDKVMEITDDEGKVTGTAGGWGKSNIHIYNLVKNTTTNKEEWKEVSYELYDTTQTDGDLFYAYVFKLTTDSHKFKISNGMPADDDATKATATELVEGGRYVFYTAKDDLENDDSILTYRVTMENINYKDYTAAYNQFETRKDKDGNEEEVFALYFLYDTTVTYKNAAGKEDSYIIRAGNYNISDAYPGFNKDITDKKGIDLFKETAKTYFTDPANYGMNKSSSDSYTPWSVEINNTSDDIDIMCDDISLTPTAYAKTSTSKRIGFRYNTAKGSDTLTLNQDITLEAGTVTIAANTIDLNGKEFTVEARTIVFQTDTILINGDDQTRISHGTYVLSDEGSTSFSVKLSTTGKGKEDWRTHYKLINSSNSALRGGYYIVPD